MLKKTLILMMAGLFLISLTGCNTIYGVGQDMEAAGEGISEAASQ